MSVVMQRAATTSSRVFQRQRTNNQPVAGATCSTSSYMQKPRQNKGIRALPNGPGPLPNKPKMDTCKYVTSNPTRERRSLGSNVSRHNSSLNIDAPTAGRKTLDDSGHVSEGRGSNVRYGNLTSISRKKSRSLSCLNTKNGSSDEFESSRTDASSSDKRGHRRFQFNSEHYANSKHRHNNSSTSSVYQSTTHLHYKDHWEDKTSQTKTHSYASDKDPCNRSSVDKSGYHLTDSDKARKVTITALPGNDLKYTRKSSLSSSNSSPSPISRGSSDGLVGLRNLGNTCFMNSILQCLSHTKPLTEQLLKSQHLKGKLIQAFVDLIKSMWKTSSNEALSPHTFKTQIQRFAPRFMGYSQQDAQEFLRFLLEGLHDDLNEVKSKPKYRQCEFPDSFSELQIAEKSWESYLSVDKSLMTDLFVGQLKSKLTFCLCNHTSVTFDPFWDLSIPIPRKMSSSSSSVGRRYSGTDDGDVTIINCMRSFTKEEVLNGDEQPTCDKCKGKGKATKKFSIQRFPPILVLHLKRFSGFSYRSKLQSNVDFPLSLDLTEFSSDPEKINPVTYSLYAVSNHSGSTYAGHYTAYCKHPISKDWHCFNDSRVDPISPSRVRGNQAYILFYERDNRKSSL